MEKNLSWTKTNSLHISVPETLTGTPYRQPFFYRNGVPGRSGLLSPLPVTQKRRQQQSCLSHVLSSFAPGPVLAGAGPDFYPGAGPAISSKVQLPPLLRQRHNAALRFTWLSSITSRSNFSLRPWVTVKPFWEYKPLYKAGYANPGKVENSLSL